MNPCEHLNNINQVKKPKNQEEPVCEECIKTNDEWLHLRTCQTCGKTLCCDSSPNKHATKHFHETKHPVVASAEPGEQWLWCYEHKEIVQY
ncbi:MAG: UBP-type zinc finger domain-containing protein [Thermonemataceae bacterium]